MTPKLLIFDVDDTLTESKQPLTSDMAALLLRLLADRKVAIISGGALPQFLKQVVGHLPANANLANLYILPTSGAAMYEWQAGVWKKIYEERLSEAQAHVIRTAMQGAAQETGVINFSQAPYGERIEYRGAQVSLSALGQQAPIELKRIWDPDHKKRQLLQAAIAKRLPEFSVAMGGMTTIDVTKKGIDKAYGIHQLSARLNLPEEEMLYVGDELIAGGNDEEVFKTNAQVRAVASPDETKQVIMSLLTN